VANARVRLNPEAPVFVSGKVSITNEDDEELKLHEAIAGLCALRNGVQQDIDIARSQTARYGEESDDDSDELPLHMQRTQRPYKIPLDGIWKSVSTETTQKSRRRSPPPMFRHQETYPQPNAKVMSAKASLPQIVEGKTLGESPPKLTYPNEPSDSITSTPADPLESILVDPRKSRLNDAGGDPIPEAMQVSGQEREDRTVADAAKRLGDNLFKLAELPETNEDMEDVYEKLGACGLLQITYDIGIAKDRGEEVKPEDWIDKILETIAGNEERIQEVFAKSKGVEAAEPAKTLTSSISTHWGQRGFYPVGKLRVF